MAKTTLSMGIGSLGDDKVELKRKFRWIFKISASAFSEAVNFLKGTTANVAGAEDVIPFAKRSLS